MPWPLAAINQPIVKIYIFFTINLFIFQEVLSQDSLGILRIDNKVLANEAKVSIIHQKIEKNKIESLHGKNPDNVSDVYRYTDKGILISQTSASYSNGDTSIVITLYFDLGNLIKAKTIYFDTNNNKNKYEYYYENNQLINKDAELSGSHTGKYYIERAKRIFKYLRKRPIKFPM